MVSGLGFGGPGINNEQIIPPELDQARNRSH